MQRVFGLTIFLGAFLLFQVQPLIARHILPWFGGGTGIWTACMLFFQIVLLAGYAYAHLLTTRVAPRKQVLVHFGALLLALPFLGIAPGATWKPTGEESPTLHILALLLTHIGVPFAVLSATSPLLTKWFHGLWPEKNPYRLYALSNAGSLLALFSYPFVVEPALRLSAQANWWAAGFVAYLIVCAACANHVRRSSPALAPGHSTQKPTLAEKGETPTLLWLALAATGSTLLLATTNRISQDLAVTPFLWVLPLGIYLLSFIITFDHERWYRRGLFMPLLAVASLGVVWMLNRSVDLEIWHQVAMYSTMLFAGTMVCHGELVRSRPDAQHLTRFYLVVSLGGAVGGIAVAGVAPMIFPDYWEFPFAMCATGFLAMVSVYQEHDLTLSLRVRRGLWGAGIAVLLTVTGGLFWSTVQSFENTVAIKRTFFGVVRVRRTEATVGPLLTMLHGRISHGSQFVETDKRQIATTYFGVDSGIGVAIREYRKLMQEEKRGLNIGIVGLGTGTLCSYGQEGDRICYYEIDSAIEEFARNYFSYLDDCRAEVEVRYGDARILMEREAQEGSREYDILIVDAFSGDAVPVHLLTEEAGALYDGHLKKGGLLALHVSNRHLDLPAVARGIAKTTGLRSVRILAPSDRRYDGMDSDWVILTHNEAFLNAHAVAVAATPWSSTEREPLVWQDDFSSIWAAMPPTPESGKWASAPNAGRFVVDFAGLLTYEDRKKVDEICRTLHHDTNGHFGILAMTIESPAAVGKPKKTLAELGSDFYHGTKMKRERNDRGLLLLVSAEDNKVTVQLGPDWEPEAKEMIRKILVKTAAAGLTAKKPSLGIRVCVEKLDLFVRWRREKYIRAAAAAAAAEK
ncbi:MAG: fused MFS/spermidine synthase [Planctomycetota bacterium]